MYSQSDEVISNQNFFFLLIERNAIYETEMAHSSLPTKIYIFDYEFNDTNNTKYYVKLSRKHSVQQPIFSGRHIHVELFTIWIC